MRTKEARMIKQNKKTPKTLFKKNKNKNKNVRGENLMIPSC